MTQNFTIFSQIFNLSLNARNITTKIYFPVVPFIFSLYTESNHIRVCMTNCVEFKFICCHFNWPKIIKKASGKSRDRWKIKWSNKTWQKPINLPLGGWASKKNVSVYVQVSRLISAAGTNIIKNIYVERKND